MGDDEVIDILEKMKKQAEEISLRKVKQSENKHEKKHKKDKEVLECFSKLERLNTELALLEEEEESILSAIKREV